MVRRFNLNFGILSLFLIGVGVFLIGMPKYADDYWFGSKLAGWFGEADPDAFNDGRNFFSDFPWDELKYSLKWRYLNDNARLCNSLATFALMLPKWIASTVAWLSFALATIFSFRFAGIRMRISALVAVACFLWSFILPWGDKMGCVVFQYNYVLSTGLFMALLWLAWSITYTRGLKRTFGAIQLLLMALTGLIAGIWHEGFAIPFLAGFAVLILLRKEWRNPSIFALSTGILLGVLWLLHSPPVERLTHGNMFDCYSPLNFLLFLTVHEVNYISIPLFIVFLFSSRRKRIFSNWPYIFFISSAFASYLLFIFLRHCERSAWWYDISSVILVMMMAHDLWPEFFRKYDLRNAIVTLPSIILMLMHWIISDVYVFKFRDEFGKVLKSQISNPGQVDFSNWPADSQLPWICASLPQRGFYQYAFYFSETYYDLGRRVNAFYVVPEDLSRITGKEGWDVAGIPGLKEYLGHLYMPADSTTFRNCIVYESEGRDAYVCNVDFGYGNTQGFISPVKFQSLADGHCYYYIFPQSAWENRIPRKWKSIVLIKDESNR